MTSEVVTIPTPCHVCGDKSSGRHYGVLTCDGCRGFFKRSVRRSFDYVCRSNQLCVVDLSRRNQCQACRMKKCLDVGMRKDAVQHERAPRNSKKQTRAFSPYQQPTVYYTFKENCNEQTNESFTTSSSTSPLTPPTELKKDTVQVSSANQLYELSIHLLYNAITWARNIPTFTDLPFADQTLLLGRGWSEIFLLSLAQWKVPLDLDFLMEIGYNNKKRENREERKRALSDLILLRTIVEKLRKLDLDNTEFACVKAVVLFKPDINGVIACAHVENLQEKGQLMLHDYLTSNNAPRERFGKILLKLPLLSLITEGLIEKYFFKGRIENFNKESPSKSSSEFPVNKRHSMHNGYADSYEHFKLIPSLYDNENRVHIIEDTDEICYDMIQSKRIQNNNNNNDNSIKDLNKENFSKRKYVVEREEIQNINEPMDKGQ